MSNSCVNPVCFSFGNIPVYGRQMLAPMDGYSDQPFRLLVRDFGSVVSYSEFINALQVIYGHPRLEEHLAHHESEFPFLYQIYDDDPQRILEAALRLQERNPDAIDINMGCSDRSVSGRGAGAGLLQSPHKIEKIFSELSKRLTIPVTGKIRLGWDEQSLNYLETAKIIEENGGAMIAVHARTRIQRYGGLADWDAIAAVKQQARIPVIGNGDVCRAADIEAMIKHTNCDAVMIGRAAVANPWIFSGKDRQQIAKNEVRQTIEKHLDACLEFYGYPRGMYLFRKYLDAYTKPYDIDRILRKTLLTCEDRNNLLNLLDQSIFLLPEKPGGAD